MAYRIEIHRAAQKQLLSLPKEAQMELAQSIDELANTPRPARCKKLSESRLWRVRVGRYRVVYAIDDESKLVTVVKVAIRGEDTYKKL
ncbi:MAG: type II toxin-antitoxin system RelE/ParE family toxin [Chloroflexota bacterium]